MHIPLLQDILIILGFSVLVVLTLQRFKLPSILGFLVTGMIIGPFGLSLVKAQHQVEILAEIGVILLLFVIGMELSLKQLASMRKTVMIGGTLQVGLTVAVATLLYHTLGYAWNESVFVGFLISLSSTAIVLKILQDRNEISSPHGRNILGILIFQDIIVVPMILVTPIMAGQSGNLLVSVTELMIKSVLVILFTFVSARYIVPRLMYQIARSGSKELFLLATFTICFFVAFLTSKAGLSLALGAFLAGLIISESEYSHQATGTILPFRELFTSFFFISVGMLLDLLFFFQHTIRILLLVLVVIVLKGSLAALATFFLKHPARTTILTGLALAQIGEFAFILSRVGIENNLLSEELNQYFLSVSIVTMLLTPFIIIYSEKISSFFLQSGFQEKLDKTIIGQDPQAPDWSQLENHLIIIGFGINGHNLAKAARYANIPYVILELDAATVRKEKKKGEPIIFGDAVHEHILSAVQVKKARVVVIAISDPQATKTIISNIRAESQSVYVIVRTRYVKEIESLIALGADEVIPEEFETSIEIFSRVLHNYLVPMDQLETLVHSIRAGNYQMLRPTTKLLPRTTGLQMPDLKITCIRVLADSGKVVGKTIADAGIRKNYGISILAIERDKNMISDVRPEERLLQNDRLYVSGDQEHIERFYREIT
jgi:monovalent cation:H+ antiporter-2, CPA2 family